MPSVGALVVSIKAETESLRNDLNKAMGRLKQFEGETRRTSDSVSSAFGKMGVGGETLKRSFGQVATGVLMMTGAFDKAGQAGKVLEQSLGAFLVGGPVGAGVALLSGAFKMLSDEVSESGRAAEEMAKQHKKALDEIDKRTKATQDRIQGLNDSLLRLRLKELGVAMPAGVLEDERAAGLLRAQAAADEERADALRRLIALQGEYDEALRRTYDARTRGTDAEGKRRANEELEAIRKRIATAYSGAGMAAVDRNTAERRYLEGGIEGQIRKLDESAEALRREATALELASDKATELATETDRVSTSTERVAEAAEQATDPMEAFWGAIERFRNGEASAAMAAWADDIRAAGVEAARVADEMQRIEDASRKQADAAEEIVREYDNQRRMAEAVTDEERDRLEILGKIERMLSSGQIGIDQAGGVFESMMGARSAERKAKAREAMERDAEKAGKSAGAKAGEAFTESFDSTTAARIDPFFSNVFSTIENGLTAAIVNGITNGGRNGSDIFRNIVNQLLSQTISSILQSGIQALFGGLLGGGGMGGGGGIVSTLVGAVGGIGGGGGGGGVLSLPDT